MPMESPIYSSTRAENNDSFPELSRLLHRRARKSASVTTIFFATPKSRELLGRGGRGVRPRLTQLSHDLQVSEVFLHYRENNQQAFWLHEDFLDDWPTKERPDAVLINERGQFVRAIEYGGAYSPARLQAMQNAFSRQGIPLEIW